MKKISLLSFLISQSLLNKSIPFLYKSYWHQIFEMQSIFFIYTPNLDLKELHNCSLILSTFFSMSAISPVPL